MKFIVENEKYGTIEYNESFWTGKRTIYVGGKLLTKKAKNKYAYSSEEGEVSVKVNGNTFSGLELMIMGSRVEIIPKTSVLEYILAVIPFIVILIWGNSVYLCSIFPVVGGAIGGAISGAASVIGMMFMKRNKNFLVKILISLVTLAITMLICFGIAVLLVNALL
jgi:hypothetical protein